MSLSLRIFVAILAFLAYVVAPITCVWGWTRWRQVRESRTLSAKLSLTGFILASGSGLVAIVMVGYAVTHGFGWYDPLLLRGMLVGLLLSLGGILFGLGGVWRPNPLRWHAPISAVATLAFWLLTASME